MEGYITADPSGRAVVPSLFPSPTMPLLSLGERALVARTSTAELVAGQGHLLIGVFVGIMYVWF